MRRFFDQAVRKFTQFSQNTWWQNINAARLTASSTFNNTVRSDLFRFSFANAVGLLAAGAIGSVTYEKYKQEHDQQIRMIEATSSLIEQQRVDNRKILLGLLKSQWVSRLAHHMSKSAGLKNEFSSLIDHDADIYARTLELKRHINVLNKHRESAQLQDFFGLHQQTNAVLDGLRVDCGNQLKLLTAARSIAQALHYYGTEDYNAASAQIAWTDGLFKPNETEIDLLISALKHNISSMIFRRTSETQTSENFTESDKIVLLQKALKEAKRSIELIENAAKISRNGLCDLSPTPEASEHTYDPSLEFYTFSPKKSIGIALVKLKQYKTAKIIFEEMVSHDGKNDLEVLTCLGIISSQLAIDEEQEEKSQHYFAQASNYFSRAIELDPNNAGLRSNRAAYQYLYTGTLDEAETDLTIADENKPGEIDILFNKAVLRFKQGKFEDALSLLNDIDAQVKRGNLLVKMLKFLVQMRLNLREDAEQSLEAAEAILETLNETYQTDNKNIHEEELTPVGIECHATFDEHRIPCKTLKHDLSEWRDKFSQEHFTSQTNFSSSHVLFRQFSSQPSSSTSWMKYLAPGQ